MVRKSSEIKDFSRIRLSSTKTRSTFGGASGSERAARETQISGQ